jgi:hypothetical protein
VVQDGKEDKMNLGELIMYKLPPIYPHQYVKYQSQKRRTTAAITNGIQDQHLESAMKTEQTK